MCEVAFARCTCNLCWTGSCPVHGPRWRPLTTISTTTTRVCVGRHCAHTAECNRSWTING